MVIAVLLGLLFLAIYVALLLAGGVLSAVLLGRLGLAAWATRIVLALTVAGAMGLEGWFLMILFTDPPREDVGLAWWYLVPCVAGLVGTLVWTTRRVGKRERERTAGGVARASGGS